MDLAWVGTSAIKRLKLLSLVPPSSSSGFPSHPSNRPVDSIAPHPSKKKESSY